LDARAFDNVRVFCGHITNHKTLEALLPEVAAGCKILEKISKRSLIPSVSDVKKEWTEIKSQCSSVNPDGSAEEKAIAQICTAMSEI
jgi:hypothetical protein